MNLELKTKIDDRLQRIANVLMLNASFTDNLGLLNGKMGIAIFFYHYARYTENKSYNNFADDLIDEIYKDITKMVPVDFSNGLTGIAWGIEYLVKNKFVEANTDVALEEIDNYILKHRLSNECMLRKYDIILGQGISLLARLSFNATQSNDELTLLLKQENLIYLIDEHERIIIEKTFRKNELETLNISVINSMLFFLLEALEFKLLSVKIKLLISSLFTDYIKTIDMGKDTVNQLLLVQLLEKSIIVLADDTSSTVQIQDYLTTLDTTINDKELKNKSWLTEQLATIYWHQMIYNTTSNENYRIITDEALPVILDNEWWSERVDNTGVYNLSLQNGLSAIGLRLLDQAINYQI